MPQVTDETLTDLDDNLSQVNRDNTQSTVDTSQDVDTQERIRSLSVTHDNASVMASQENQRRDRTQQDQLFQQTLNFTTQLQTIALQGMQNMVANAQRTEGQHLRHVDHTLIDLHGSDVNPGAIPNADEGVPGAG
jgi:hypothetical protein